MKHLHISSSLRTAEVDFSIDPAHLSFTGISVPENAEEFFQPLHDWITELCAQHKGEITFRIAMSYFNTATIRHLLIMMKKLVGALGNRLTIEWVYENGDEEIRERGQDLSEILKFPFNYKMI